MGDRGRDRRCRWKMLVKKNGCNKGRGLWNLLGGEDFKEDGEDSEGRISIIDNLIRLGNGNAENTQEDVPQVEAELVLHMPQDIRRSCMLVRIGIR